MEATGARRKLEYAVLVYLILIAFVTTAFGVLNGRIKSVWAVGDWLINYQGGFVRRGLIGEVALQAAHALHISPIVVVIFLQLCLYYAIFYCVWSLAKKSSLDLAILAAIVSPATLAFQVLDPPAGFRKDIIFLAGLSLLLLLLKRSSTSAIALSVYLSCTVVLALLCHESLSFYLPYYFGAVYIANRDFRLSLKIAVVPVILAAITFVVVYEHPGSPQVAQQICGSLGATMTVPNAGLCGGAIYYIGNDQNFYHDEVMMLIHVFHYWALYPVLLCLALVPLGLAFLRPKSGEKTNNAMTALAFTVACAALTSVPLFYVGADWGRWICVHATSIMLILLFIDQTTENKETAPVWMAGSHRWLATGLLAVYATCWTLPHVPIFEGRFGYFSLVKYLAQYSGKNHPH
jgi:hypothetical protein